MTIMLVGGGTGGHILPLLAVAHKLKVDHPKLQIVAVIDKTTKFGHHLDASSDIDAVARINAGKLRRYPNQSLVESLLDVKTIALNIRDIFRTLIGIFQALRLLTKHKPDAIFIKGGFVGVPVGIASKIKNVPYITHDSDASPGLANRIIGRWARIHTVGMATSLYNYPKSKTIQVGIPTAPEFENITSKLKKAYREQIGVPLDAKMIFVTGGSQGSDRLNNIMSNIGQKLIAKNNIFVFHQTGSNIPPNLPTKSKQYFSSEYLDDLYLYSGAADVIVSRAGSVVAEFAVQGKAVIVVPAPQLADGHQLKNARILQEAKSTIVLDETTLIEDPTALLNTLLNLIEDEPRRRSLANNLAKVYPSGATDKIVDALLKVSE